MTCLSCGSARNWHTGTKCKKIGPEHAKWRAVVGNYVYIHNAFRNHLDRVIELAESRKLDMAKRTFETWQQITVLHARSEDEILMPALEGRGFVVPDYIHEGHLRLKAAMDAVTSSFTVEALEDLRNVLLQHLDEEEDAIMPAMVEHFSEEELWALDSCIVNPKLDYADTPMLKKITIWWFKNITAAEGWQLFKNFKQAGKRGNLQKRHWKSLVKDVPRFKDMPIEDVAFNKLLPDEVDDAPPEATGESRGDSTSSAEVVESPERLNEAESRTGPSGESGQGYDVMLKVAAQYVDPDLKDERKDRIAVLPENAPDEQEVIGI